MSTRWEQLALLQKEYEQFDTFLIDVMESLLGFNCSPLQLDIAAYLALGPKHRMIQAQRGQAKTTITAAYAVWRLIHDPTARILIISSGGDMAKEIANWIIQIVKGMDELECLRPDRSLGDRDSVSAFDVHKELKGPEKSPSVACLGITANMQGKRADILIADDIESAKNSQTEHQRERLRHLTKDFTSICSNGDIIYLGTPQSIDSIYNGLVSRGYTIRVWPGRYPTKDEQSNYGGCLSPTITRLVDNDPSLRTGGGPTGTRGQPTDPVILDEYALTKKEIDQGTAYFQLQHMLDTRLMDADRFPLKVSKLIFAHIGTRAPLEVTFQRSEEYRIYAPSDFPVEDFMYRAAGFGQEFAPFQGTHMYVDPAGGGANGDETAYAITKFSAGRVYLVASGGVPGGLDEASLDALTDIAVLYKPTQIDIEKNFGNGALASVWRPRLLKKHRCHIEEVWESGQKELRIIDILEPVIGSSRLVVDEELIQNDWQSVQKYPAEKRSSYSLLYQMARITRDRGALMHDDRLDALAGSVRHWVEALEQDSERVLAQAKKQQWQELMRNPMGNGRPAPGFNKHSGTISAFYKHRRKV